MHCSHIMITVVSAVLQCPQHNNIASSWPPNFLKFILFWLSAILNNSKRRKLVEWTQRFKLITVISYAKYIQTSFKG